MKCTGYQFTAAGSLCKTFTEIVNLEGDGVQGVECSVKEKDLVQIFSEYSGKCARIDGEDIIADNQQV
jgi:hypothetical protein